MKSTIEFEHAHVRATEGSESGENDEGLKMVLKHSKLVKEERAKYVVENKTHDEEVEGKMSLELGNMKLEKSGVEVTKETDSDRSSLECTRHECGENLELINIEARNVFACCIPIMVKCVAGINAHDDRIKNTDKRNVAAA